MNGKPGTITLIGSGEMAESMAKTHRLLMAHLNEPVRAVFIDTPAGFEVNIDEISAKAIDYFRQHFAVSLAVASYKCAPEAAPAETEEAVRKLTRANYIFAGPGSPTYAVRNWRDAPVWQAIARQLQEGVQLVLASAAAIAISRFALPVYEIYKAGQDPHWRDGLNLMAPFGLDLVVIPHWNNAESKYDTRFCFMGERRFVALERALPEPTVVLGIDEYTACSLDLNEDRALVSGAGAVTIRRRGEERSFQAGSSFSIDELRTRARPASPRRKESSGAELASLQPPSAARPSADQVLQTLTNQVASARRAFDAPEPAWSMTDASRSLYELAQALDSAEQAGANGGATQRARATLGELALDLSQRTVDGEQRPGDIAPLVNLLIDLRAELRAAKQFALADRIRERLSHLGIALEDRPTGTQWRQSS